MSVYVSTYHLFIIYLLTHLSSISRFIIGLWPVELQGLVNQLWEAVSSVSRPWSLRADSQKGKMDMEQGNQEQLEAGRMRGAPMTDWNLYCLSLPPSLYLQWWECPIGEGHTLCYEVKHTLTMELEKLKKRSRRSQNFSGPLVLPHTNKVSQEINMMSLCWECISCPALTPPSIRSPRATVPLLPSVTCRRSLSPMLIRSCATKRIWGNHVPA